MKVKKGKERNAVISLSSNTESCQADRLVSVDQLPLEVFLPRSSGLPTQAI